MLSLSINFYNNVSVLNFYFVKYLYSMFIFFLFSLKALQFLFCCRKDYNISALIYIKTNYDSLGYKYHYRSCDVLVSSLTWNKIKISIVAIYRLQQGPVKLFLSKLEELLISIDKRNFFFFFCHLTYLDHVFRLSHANDINSILFVLDLRITNHHMVRTCIADSFCNVGRYKNM